MSIPQIYNHLVDNFFVLNKWTPSCYHRRTSVIYRTSLIVHDPCYDKKKINDANRILCCK